MRCYRILTCLHPSTVKLILSYIIEPTDDIKWGLPVYVTSLNFWLVKGYSRCFAENGLLRSREGGEVNWESCSLGERVLPWTGGGKEAEDSRKNRDTYICW